MSRELPYQKILSARKFTAAGLLLFRSTLWQAVDHLLLVTDKAYSESYRRFYFTDIQAIIVRRTRTHIVFGTILAILILILGIFIAGDVEFGKWLFGIPAALLALAFVVNLISGPTCRCHIVTAVQTTELPAVDRVKKAHKLLEQLSHRIQEKQVLDPGIEPALPDLEPDVASPVGDGAVPVPAPATGGAACVHYYGRWHQYMYLVLLFVSFNSAIDILHNHIGISLVGYGLSAALVGLLIVSLKTQRQGQLTAALRQLTWWIVICLVAEMAVYWVLTMQVALTNPEAMNNSWDIMLLLTNLDPSENTFLLVALVAATLVYFGSAVTGMTLLARHRRSIAKPPPVPHQ